MEKEIRGVNPIFEIVKAVIIAVGISLIGVLIAAFAVQMLGVSGDFIPAINGALKVISVLFGCLIAFRSANCGWVKGIAAGIFYALLAYGLFSLLSGEFVLDITLLNDVGLGSLSGFISGIISSLIRK